MPFLSQEDRDRHAAPRRCVECKREVYKEYCSRCDEFWEAGHKKGCSCEQVRHGAGEGTTGCGGDRGYR
jgi:hypothetical protein